MFPSRDLIDGYERLLERDRVHQLLLKAHPALADRIRQAVRDDVTRHAATSGESGGPAKARSTEEIGRAIVEALA